jgi:hypothetical protein
VLNAKVAWYPMGRTSTNTRLAHMCWWLGSSSGRQTTIRLERLAAF